MAPLVIEGDTLRQKHRNYNKIVNEAINNKEHDHVDDINYEELDQDNLFKIDLASSNRNVEYILKILKCKDMLYISRAIKRSTWLITDPEYSKIINSTYLFNELFPQMTTKAINKFLLHIRLNLKDEKRVEDFFNYYKERDIKTAFKWLPNCSNVFIEKILEKHADDMPNRLITRLCEKSITFLVIYFKYSNVYYKSDILSSTVFLMKNNAEKYLNIIEEHLGKNTFVFTSKFTDKLMKMCSERVMNNFELYAHSLHVPTFTKYIKREESKDFILKHMKNPKIKSLFAHDKARPFINRLPLENRFEVVKEIFIDKKYNKEEDIYNKEEEPIPYDSDEVVEDYCGDRYLCASIMRPKENIYSWYVYAPFSTAFAQLKTFIHKESNPKERLGMFKVLLSCTRNKTEDIYTLLKHYRENHINEAFKFKIQFVNMLLSSTKAHTFDKTTWGYLNDLFTSMDVYSESDNQDSVQSCIKAIVLRNVVQNEIVPKIIEKKIVFDTYKDYQKKITKEEHEKLFSYLYEYITKKIEQDIVDQQKFAEIVDVLESTLRLLVDWDKELQDFPQIVQKIKEIINLKKAKAWDSDVAKLYNVKKSWRKLLFNESILLHPFQEVFINALKHGPELLETYKTEVEVICLRDNVLVDQFLKKIRVYFPLSLANYYKSLFLNNINHKNNHKSVIIGLCTLYSQKEISSLVNKYIPTEGKIDWNQHNEIELSLCKNIAGRLHLARPQPSLDIALPYAKGDYVQYVLPSLNAILYNMSCSYASDNIKKLIDTPVSLQKHGIRVSSKKLKNKELPQLYSDIWKVNKNSTIRFVVFSETFNILCKERDEETIKCIWDLLSMFIDNLTSEEDQKIYNKLGKALDVPECVRGQYWMKSYRFLKSLPPSENCGTILNQLRSSLSEVLEYMDDEFMKEMFLNSLDNRLSTETYNSSDLVVQFIWLGKSEKKQMKRYNDVLLPILERIFALWDTKTKDKYYVRSNLHDICKSFASLFVKMSFEKEIKIPIAVLTDMLNKIESNLSKHESYVLALRLKLTIIFGTILSDTYADKSNKELLDEIKNSSFSYYKWQPIFKKASSEIGKNCANYLKEDVKNIYPTIYNIFANVLFEVSTNFDIGMISVLLIQKGFLESKDFIQGYLLVIEVLQKQMYRYSDDDAKKVGTELLEEIAKHPAEEVKMHYWHYFYEKGMD